MTSVSKMASKDVRGSDHEGIISLLESVLSHFPINNIQKFIFYKYFCVDLHFYAVDRPSWAFKSEYSVYTGYLNQS
jgi:hypothetical protein